MPSTTRQMSAGRSRPAEWNPIRGISLVQSGPDTWSPGFCFFSFPLTRVSFSLELGLGVKRLERTKTNPKSESPSGVAASQGLYFDHVLRRWTELGREKILESDGPELKSIFWDSFLLVTLILAPEPQFLHLSRGANRNSYLTGFFFVRMSPCRPGKVHWPGTCQLRW